MPAKKKKGASTKAEEAGNPVTDEVDAMIAANTCRMLQATRDAERSKKLSEELYETLAQERVQFESEKETLESTISQLEDQREQLVTDYERSKRQQADVEQSLRDELAQLREQLEASHRETHEKGIELAVLQRDAEREMEALTESVDKVTSLEEEITTLRNQLKAERTEYREEMDALERRFYRDKDRILSEARAKVRAAREEKYADDQLSDVMRRTLIENQQLSQELSLLTREIEELLAKNENQDAHAERLTEELEIERNRADMAVRKNRVLESILKRAFEGLKELHQEVQTADATPRTLPAIQQSKTGTETLERSTPKHGPKLSAVEKAILSHLAQCSPRPLHALAEEDWQQVYETLIQRLLVHLGYHPFNFLDPDNVTETTTTHAEIRPSDARAELMGLLEDLDTIPPETRREIETREMFVQTTQENPMSGFESPLYQSRVKAVRDIQGEVRSWGSPARTMEPKSRRL